MKVKRVLASPFCWLTFRVRVPYEYVEKLRLLCEVYKYRTMEKLMTQHVTSIIESNQDEIEAQRKKEAEEQRKADEYWRYKNGEDK